MRHEGALLPNASAISICNRIGSSMCLAERYRVLASRVCNGREKAIIPDDAEVFAKEVARTNS